MPSNYGAILSEVIKPFGRAAGYVATISTGAQYGATVSSAGSTSYITVEEVTMPMPVHAIMLELQIALTTGLGISTTTDSPKLKYLIKDEANASYDTLSTIISTTLAAYASTGTNLTDWTSPGLTVTPSDGTNFTGRGPFNLAVQIASNASTSNARGAVKGSSYLLYNYRLVA